MKKELSFKKAVLKSVAKGIYGVAEKSVDIQCAVYSYEPKIPQALKKESK